MIRKFKKRPVVIEAIQLHLDDNDTVSHIMSWAGDAVGFYDYDPETNQFGRCSILTLEGEMQVSEGDWVIKGVQGEFYPCKPDIFDKTYEEQ